MDARFVPMTELAPALLEVLGAGGSVEITTTGSSMRPLLLHRKSTVRLRAADALRRGDVVLYRYPSGAFALHRIYRIRADGTLLCRGDNVTFTEHVRREWVCAVMTDFNRSGRKWTSASAASCRLYAAFCLLTWHLRALLLRVRQHLARRLKR